MDQKILNQIADHLEAIADLLRTAGTDPVVIEPIPREPDRSYLLDEVDLDYWFQQYGETPMPSFAMCAGGNGFLTDKEDKTWMTNYLRGLDGIPVDQGSHIFVNEGRGYYKKHQQYYTMFRCRPVA